MKGAFGGAGGVSSFITTSSIDGSVLSVVSVIIQLWLMCAAMVI